MAYHKSFNYLSISEFNTFHCCCNHFVGVRISLKRSQIEIPHVNLFNVCV